MRYRCSTFGCISCTPGSWKGKLFIKAIVKTSAQRDEGSKPMSISVMPIQLKPHQAHPALPSAKPWVAAEDRHISWAAQQKLQAALKTDLLWNRRINVILLGFKEADLKSFLNARWKKKSQQNQKKAKNQCPASWRSQSWCSTQNVLYNKDSQCFLQAECWPVVPITAKSGTSEPPSVLRGEISSLFIYWNYFGHVKSSPAIDALQEEKSITFSKLPVPWGHSCKTSILSRPRVPGSMTWHLTSDTSKTWYPFTRCAVWVCLSGTSAHWQEGLIKRVGKKEAGCYRHDSQYPADRSSR